MKNRERISVRWRCVMSAPDSKKLKKVLIMIVCIVIVVLLHLLLVAAGVISGFGKLKNALNPDDKTPILNYLESRYGEEFVIADMESNSNESGGTDTMFYFTSTAYCYPAAHTEYVFQTRLTHNRDKSNTITDNYTAAVLGTRLAQEFQDKLDGYFGDALVRAEFVSAFAYDGDAAPASVALEDFIRAYRADYPAQTEPFWIEYVVTVNNDVYTPAEYAAEYDVLFGALQEICEETHTDGTLRVSFGTQKWYDETAAWAASHTPGRAMPGSVGAGFNNSIYDELADSAWFCYSHVTHAPEKYFTYSEDEPLTRERYIEERQKANTSANDSDSADEQNKG